MRRVHAVVRARLTSRFGTPSPERVMGFDLHHEFVSLPGRPPPYGILGALVARATASRLHLRTALPARHLTMVRMSRRAVEPHSH